MEMHLPKSLSPEKLSEHLPHKVKGAVEGMNVGTIERIASGLVGVFLLRSAMKRGMVGKSLMIPAALAAFKRAATGKCELYQAAGLSSAKEESSVESDSVTQLKRNFNEKSLDQTSGQSLYN